MNQILTVKSSVSMWTGTLVGTIAVVTCAPIHARLRVTFIDIMLAVVTSKTRVTYTCKSINTINAGSTVEAGALSAVRSVDFTMDATEARWACTGVAVHTVCAVGSIFTWVTFTLINVLLTFDAPKTRQAGAQKAIHLIFADPTITTRIWLAIINVCFTVTPSEAWFAATSITAQCVLTTGSVETGILHTFFDIHIAGLTLPSFRTNAGEALIIF